MNVENRVFQKLFKEEKTELSKQKIELGMVQDFEKAFENAYKNLIKTEPEYGKILNESRTLNKNIKKVDEDIDNAISIFNILERKSNELGIELDGKLKGSRGRLNNFKKTTTQILSELKNII